MGILQKHSNKMERSCFTLEEFENFLISFPIIKEKYKDLVIFKEDFFIYIEMDRINESQKNQLGEAYNVIAQHIVVKPKDCVIGFGIPTTYTAFLKKNIGYVQNTTWAKYYHDIILPMNTFKRKIIPYGVPIIQDLTLSHFGELFQYKRFKVIILFSHWEDEHIEFAEGLVHINEIVERIPNDFPGILDLCVCHPHELLKRLRKERQNLSPRSTKAEVTPSIWLDFYMALFSLLNEKNVTYKSALLKVLEIYGDIIKKYHEKTAIHI